MKTNFINGVLSNIGVKLDGYLDSIPGSIFKKNPLQVIIYGEGIVSIENPAKLSLIFNMEGVLKWIEFKHNPQIEIQITSEINGYVYKKSDDVQDFISSPFDLIHKSYFKNLFKDDQIIKDLYYIKIYDYLEKVKNMVRQKLLFNNENYISQINKSNIKKEAGIMDIFRIGNKVTTTDNFILKTFGEIKERYILPQYQNQEVLI